MRTKPVKFDSLKEALSAINNKLEASDAWQEESELLKTIKSRSVLFKYMGAQ